MAEFDPTNDSFEVNAIDGIKKLVKALSASGTGKNVKHLVIGDIPLLELVTNIQSSVNLLCLGREERVQYSRKDDFWTSNKVGAFSFLVFHRTDTDCRRLGLRISFPLNSSL